MIWKYKTLTYTFAEITLNKNQAYNQFRVYMRSLSAYNLVSTHFMRQLFGLIITLTFLASCSEPYIKLDPNTFNEKISSRADIQTPEKLMEIYYDNPTSEGNSKRTIQTKVLGDNSVEITLIHEGLQDDSESGEKIVMTAKQIGQTWSVIEIKKNWKCRNGRGHKSWGTTPCY